MTIEEFGQKIKAKYPEYQDITDADLGQKVLAKYPEYKDLINVAPGKGQQVSKDFLSKTSGILDAIFGGGKIGEAIGTQIAKARATPEERPFVSPGPSFGEVAGDVGQIGLT